MRLGKLCKPQGTAMVGLIQKRAIEPDEGNFFHPDRNARVEHWDSRPIACLFEK
jgi:hypothetical protein